MVLVRKTAPDQDPISLSEAKAHLKVIGSEEDETILRLIRAVVDEVDGATGWLGRCLCPQVWTLKLDAFPRTGGVRIPLAPVQTVDEVRYLDPDGVVQTWAGTDWEALPHLQETKLLLPAYGKSWPSVREGRMGVEVDFTAGYASPDHVPGDLFHGLLLVLGRWFENREDVIKGTISSKLPFAAETLLSKYRVY